MGENVLPFPREPVTGMVLVMPGHDTAFPSNHTWFPPAWPDANGTYWAWYGGTWTIDQWDTSGISISLEDGELCAFENSGYFTYDPATCVPDSGTLKFVGVDSAPVEVLVQDGNMTGEPTGYTDPRTGELLCDW